MADLKKTTVALLFFVSAAAMDGTSGIGNDDCREKNQCIELRLELEDLMEYISRHSHEEPVSSFEERYLLLTSSYSNECLKRAVLISDNEFIAATAGANGIDDNATRRLPLHLACDKGAPLPIIKSLLEADIENQTINKE